jgi:hypothetical protein|tara:strand:- start:69 stop:281 length:213 start_codon:yes stop_codon:yes gene_type:complete
MRTLILIILTSQTDFTVSSKLNLIYINQPNEIINCFQLIDDVRENIATYNNKTNQWLIKDGSQFIGGMCK